MYLHDAETTESEITTTEIIKRRDVGPYGIRSEYCIRKIICPIGVPETPKGKNSFISLTLSSKCLVVLFSIYLFYYTVAFKCLDTPSQ